jgi:hypothetical protein
MTPRSKFDNRRRSSLIKSTKAQRARAEAIALKKERLSVACSNTQSNFPKSPHPVHQPKESRPNLVNKNVPTVTQRSLSTSRASLAASATASANLKKSKTIPLARVSVSTPIEDRIARIQEAKEKANSFLRASTSKSHSKVPNFDKCHEKNFKKQKSIASLVKEVLSPSLLPPSPSLPSLPCLTWLSLHQNASHEIHSKMTEAMSLALETPEKIPKKSPTETLECQSTIKNPFEVILTQVLIAPSLPTDPP